jgi:hypothetical protein
MVAFSVPLLTADMPDAATVNAALAARIAAARIAGTGRQDAGTGGWTSARDLWDWPGDDVAALRGWMHRAVLMVAGLSAEETDPGKVDVQYRTVAWAGINGPGDHDGRHSHPRFDWALVYFVATGIPDPGRPLAGQLELYDPRRLADLSALHGFGFGRSVAVDPSPGKLVLFPAWMEHCFHPWSGSGESVSVRALVKVTGGRHSGLGRG